MTFDEAVRELKSPGKLGIDGYVRRVTASATYYAHYISRTEHPAPPAKPPRRDTITVAKTKTRDVNWAEVRSNMERGQTPRVRAADFQTFANGKAQRDRSTMKSIVDRTRDFWAKAEHG